MVSLLKAMSNSYLQYEAKELCVHCGRVSCISDADAGYEMAMLREYIRHIMA